MPRYFFHTSGTAPYVDREGWDLAGIEAAWSLAVSSTGELLRDLDGKLPDHSEIVTTITDEEGDTLISIRVVAHLHSTAGQP